MRPAGDSPGPDHGGPSGTTWIFAVRTAMASSLLMIALTYALKHFFGASDLALVTLTVVIGLPVGISLPAAKMPIPRWLDDPIDDECASA